MTSLNVDDDLGWPTCSVASAAGDLRSLMPRQSGTKISKESVHGALYLDGVRIDPELSYILLD